METIKSSGSDNAGSQTIHLDLPELPFAAREAINILRGNIQLSGFKLKTVALTSCHANEGKSSVAMYLAASLASLKKKTLFLDCDIRNSVVRNRYNITEKQPGLTEFLCGVEPIVKVICHTDRDKYLDVILSGAVAPNPSELLSGVYFSKLLSILRSHYDYIILDTPPVNVVVDGVMVAKQCDGTILVVESGVTDRAQALHAKRQLDFAGVKLLGCVLNKVGSDKSGYGYGYGKYGYGKYGYGYGYGKEYGKTEASKK